MTTSWAPEPSLHSQFWLASTMTIGGRPPSLDPAVRKSQAAMAPKQVPPFFLVSPGITAELERPEAGLLGQQVPCR